MGKSWLRAFALELLAYLAYFFQQALLLSCKKRLFYVDLGSSKAVEVGKDYADILPQSPVVVLFWHKHLLLTPYIHKKIWRKRPVSVMISTHKDGKLISKVIKKVGLKTIEGSTYKNPTAALREAFRVIDRGEDIAITPDGPRGPYKSVSAGSYSIARKKKALVMLLSYEASSFWQLKSWDLMQIPKPFSRINFFCSLPITVNNLEDDEAQSMIKQGFSTMEQL